MKQCMHCGKKLPDNASFCPVCASSLVAKQEFAGPVLRLKKLIGLLISVALLLAVSLTAYLLFSPKTFNAAAAELIYTTGGRSFHLLLRNVENDHVHWKTPMDTRSLTIPSGGSDSFPLLLFAYDEDTGENAAEDFRKLIKAPAVTPRPLDGADPVICSEPLMENDYPLPVVRCEVTCTDKCGTNIVDWTLKLANGDTLILHETVIVN